MITCDTLRKSGVIDNFECCGACHDCEKKEMFTTSSNVELCCYGFSALREYLIDLKFDYLNKINKQNIHSLEIYNKLLVVLKVKPENLFLED